MANENTYNTKYGAVNVSTSSSSDITTLNLGFDKTVNTVKAEINPDGSIKPSSTKDFAAYVKADVLSGNTFGINLRSDGSLNPLTSDLTANTVEIDDDPTNTYGLASKKLVRDTMSAHTVDSDAHKALFNAILKQITDLYEEKGELHAFKISDNYGNVINANGKAIWNGDVLHPKYIVFSDEKNPDIDSKFSTMSAEISGKQDKLTVGQDLTLTTSGHLGVANMRYDDTFVRNKISLIESKETSLTNRIISIENKESTWDGKQDHISSPSDIGAQPEVKHSTTGTTVKMVVVDEEPEVKEDNTLYFILES